MYFFVSSFSVHIRIHIPESSHHQSHSSNDLIGHSYGHGSSSSSGLPIEVLGSIIGSSSSGSGGGSSGGHYSGGGYSNSNSHSSLSPGKLFSSDKVIFTFTILFSFCCWNNASF